MHIQKLFEECGLPLGRSIGNKGTYYRTHPDALFLPGARVCSAQQILWTGDLDLTSADGSRLRVLARRLQMSLYLHVGATIRGPADDPTRFPEAIVTADSIELTRSGLTYLGERMRNGEIRITRTRRTE